MYTTYHVHKTLERSQFTEFGHIYQETEERQREDYPKLFTGNEDIFNEHEAPDDRKQI